MGLFDGIMGTQVNFTPRLALAAGLIYISAADGHLDPNERGDIFKVIPEDAVLDQAVHYTRSTPYLQYLEQAARLLNPSQKLCLMLNAADLAMGDGYIAPNEQQQLMQMAQAFQIPNEHLTPYIQTLMIKNNLTVFR